MIKNANYGFYIDKFYQLNKPTEKFILDDRLDYKTSRIQLSITNQNAIPSNDPFGTARRINPIGRYTSAELDIYSYMNYTEENTNSERVFEMKEYLYDNIVKEIPTMLPYNLASIVYEIYDDKNVLIASGEHAAQCTSKLGVSLDEIDVYDEQLYNEKILYSTEIQLDIPQSSAYNISNNHINKYYTLRIPKLKVYNTTRDGNTMRDIYITQPNLAGSFNNATFSTYNSASKPFEISNSNFISNVVAEKTLIDQVLVPVEVHAPPIEQDILIIETDDNFSYMTKLDASVLKVKVNMEIMADVLCSVYNSQEIQDIIDINNGKPVVQNIELLPDRLSIERGRTYQLEPIVTGRNLSEEAGVVLTLLNNSSKDTYIDDKLVLHIAMDETSNELSVSMYSTEDDDKVFIRQYVVIDYIPVPEVKIIPKEAIIRTGEKLQFTTETVLVPEGTVQEFNITGNNSTNTYIDINGMLTVADDETSTNIIVVVNIPTYSIFDTCKLTVEYPTEEPSVYITPKYVTVPVGRTYQFDIQKYNIPEEHSVTCNIGGKKSPNTSITPEGLLTIASDEMAHSLVVVVNVLGMNIGDSAAVLIDHEPFIPHIVATPPIASVALGESVNIDLYAEALTKYYRINTVLTGQTSNDTYIENVYMAVDDPSHIEYNSNVMSTIYIGQDETAENITLSATIPELGLLTQVDIIIEQPKIIITPDKYDAVPGEQINFISTFENVDEEQQKMIKYSLVDPSETKATISEYGIMMIPTNAPIGNVIHVIAEIEELNISSNALITIVDYPSIILLPEEDLLHPGDTLQFTIRAEGLVNEINTYIRDNTSADTYIDDANLLHIAEDETSPLIQVIADSDVKFLIPTISNITIEYIPEITLSPIQDTIIPGGKLQFIVTSKYITNELRYNIEGNTSVDTVFDDTGLLTVGADESALELLLFIDEPISMTRSNTSKITVMY